MNIVQYSKGICERGVHKLDSIENYKELIREYAANNFSQMTREPAGYLNHPFIVPGSQSYSDGLWDWDSWLTNVAIRQIMKDIKKPISNFDVFEKGCILNFLENTGEYGCMPIVIAPKVRVPAPDEKEVRNIHKPCLAQHAAFIVKENGGDAEWLRDKMYIFERYIGYYQKNMYHQQTGLYFWIDDMGIGVDNDPSTFYQPDRSCASIYLNCLMYKELLAMDYIYEQLDIHNSLHKIAAENLKKAINDYLWDERNGNYYSANLNLKPVYPNREPHSGCPRHWNSVILKIDSWSGFMAMWAGVASKERAARMVSENMMDERLFCAAYGIRTLAKTEQMYCVVKSGNPSCWLGPVWGVSNYLCYRGLVNYGFLEEARQLAVKTITLFGEDIQRTGEMHEYYHPDTGEGVNNPGFQNWNLLVNNMIAELDSREVIYEF